MTYILIYLAVCVFLTIGTVLFCAGVTLYETRSIKLAWQEVKAFITLSTLIRALFAPFLIITLITTLILEAVTQRRMWD